jgi:Peptidase family U32
MSLSEIGEWRTEIDLKAPSRPWSESALRFPDGRRWHIEIASVEGPRVLAAVLEEADNAGVAIHRVSQGSGVMMLSDGELDEMSELGAARSIEVCLFLGPRGSWDTGGQALVTAAAAGVARGAEALEACVAEARRACAHGIRSLLVGDIGVLAALSNLRALGRLPADLRFKTSAVLCAANPAAARVYDQLGADTINVATDLEVAMVGAIRAATRLALDIYVEVPDDMGGFVRSYAVPDLIRVAAPVHIKFGLRNSQSVYPSGLHLEAVAIAQAREKVRRAHNVERLVHELAPDLAGNPASVSGASR